MKELMKKIKEFFIRLFTTGPAPIAAPVVQPVEEKVGTVLDVQKPVIEIPEQAPTVVQALLEPVVNTTDVSESPKKQQPRKKRATSEKTKADVKSASNSSSGGRSKPKSTGHSQRRTKPKMQ